ncbi:hypothetical protein NPIL_537421 [Nephila pilipes]|uniref:Uncharacterized protein n=1 Tax=Nephila pilipes TaxID=299642 RepID=A0A8X6MSY4_NEPPI|nr:hypothetical protein NPIL_537421 [Nephila pilipes]
MPGSKTGRQSSMMRRLPTVAETRATKAEAQSNEADNEGVELQTKPPLGTLGMRGENSRYFKVIQEIVVYMKLNQLSYDAHYNHTMGDKCLVLPSVVLSKTAGMEALNVIKRFEKYDNLEH